MREIALALLAPAALAVAGCGGGSPSMRPPAPRAAALTRAQPTPAATPAPTAAAREPPGLLLISDKGVARRGITVGTARRLLVLNTSRRPVTLTVTGSGRAASIPPGPPQRVALPAHRTIYSVTVGGFHATVTVR
jgi:hypothetical protein